MTIANAQQIALEYVIKHSEGFTPQIIDEATIATDHGWIFFYNSKEFLENNDFSYAIAGNGPIAVKRDDGTVYGLDPSISIEAVLSDFKRRIKNAVA